MSRVLDVWAISAHEDPMVVPVLSTHEDLGLGLGSTPIPRRMP